jgi:putative hydrolase of the HAD superfamily
VSNGSIKVIAFDLDDTLWPIAPTIINAERQLHRWLSSNIEGWQFNAAQLHEVRRDILTIEPALSHQLTELRRRCISEAMFRISVPAHERRSTEAMEVFLTARNEVQFFEGALDSLRVLAKTYTLGALSNGNADIHRLGLSDLFRFAFSAEQVGAAKPAPNLFDAAISHTQVAPEEMIYVGDDPQLDIDAANRRGLKTILVTNGKLRKEKHRLGETKPDVSIEKIADLPTAVEKLAGLA